MISPTMAVAAVGTGRFGRAEPARQARFARLVALILDTIFVGILSSIATAVYGTTQVTGTSFPGGGFPYVTTQTEVPAIWTAGIWLIYYTVCEAMFSATPGKALNGLRVVSDDGRPLELRSVVIRNLLRLVDVLPGMYAVGAFSVLVTPYSQRLGDLVARTTVVFRQHAVEPGAARTSGQTAKRALIAALLAVLLFTAGFDYFGRPPVVIDGMFKEHRLLNPDLQSYSLGQASWGFGMVTFPLRGRTATESCSGSVQLSWQLFGWAESTSQLLCVPS